MNVFTRLSAVSLILGLGACAHTPPVSMRYYYSSADLGLKVTRTVACDQADNPIVANSVTPTVRHSADRAGEVGEVSVAGLRGPLSDSDLKFDFQEDGRLKGVNSTSTGQGEAILKSTFSFFGALFGMDGGSSPEPVLCAKLKSWNGGKPVTLVYEGNIDPGQTPGEVTWLEAEPASAHYADQLKSAIGGVCAQVVSREPGLLPVSYTPQKGDVLLTLKQPGLARIKVNAGTADVCGPVIWTGAVPAGQIGTIFTLPIPKAAAFGKQTFVAAINDSGSLSSVQYARTNGAGQALNVANLALDLLDGETDAQKAARLKAEADLIAAQARLVACRANWQGCK